MEQRVAKFKGRASCGRVKSGGRRLEQPWCRLLRMVCLKVGGGLVADVFNFRIYSTVYLIIAKICLVFVTIILM